MLSPANSGDAPLVEFEAVRKVYTISAGMFRRQRPLSVINEVDLTVRKGEVVAIVGESGCGKTTLMRMMLGLLNPTSGRVRFAGQDIGSLDHHSVARRVQPVFQDPFSSLNPRKTIGSIVEFPLKVHGIGSRAERRSRALDYLARCGLPEHFAKKYPNQLSGGQRQRVAIARALVMNPELLVCDEPTSALDVSVQAQILNLLADLKRTFGLTYIVISHNLAVVEHIASRVVVMYLGRIVEEGPTEEIFSNPRHPYTRALLGAVLTPQLGLGMPGPRLHGQFPNPLDPPAGCPFHPRCEWVMKRCRTNAPRLQQGVACHLYEDTESIDSENAAPGNI